MTIYLSGMSEAGKSIVAPNARTPATSIAGSTALHSGNGENSLLTFGWRTTPNRREESSLLRKVISQRAGTNLSRKTGRERTEGGRKKL